MTLMMMWTLVVMTMIFYMKCVMVWVGRRVSLWALMVDFCHRKRRPSLLSWLSAFLGSRIVLQLKSNGHSSISCSSISVILNRGPHGPPGGNLQVLGRNTEHLGNWGGMDPFGGNQQIAINRPGCSSSWRIVAASPVFVDVTLRPEGSSALPQDTVPRPKWTLGLWRTTFLAPRHSYFWQKWKCMHYRHNEFQNFLQNWALDAHDALHRKSTLAFIRHCSRVGGGEW